MAEYEREGSEISSHTERQLKAQIRKANEQHQTQVSVNKTLAAKLLRLEKQVLDERKARQNAEMKLRSMLPGATNYDSSRAPANASDDLMQVSN